MTVTIKEIIELKRKVLKALNDSEEGYMEDRINDVFDDFLIEKADQPIQLSRSPFEDKLYKGFEINDSKGFNGDITPNVFFKDDGDENPL